MGPKDPATGKAVDRVGDRIEKLIEDLDAEDERIIIPTPALCEFLVLAGKDGPAYLDKIHESKTLLIKPFDEMAAVELAAMEHDARRGGDKRGGTSSPWTKVKFDRQIVAVAKVNGAKRIYSDDEDVIKFAQKAGLEVVSTWSLPLPAAKQTKMEFEPKVAVDPLQPPHRAIRLEDEDDGKS